MALRSNMLSTSNLMAILVPAHQRNIKPMCVRVCAFSVVFMSCLLASAQAIEPSKVPLDERLHQRPSVDEVARQISEKLQWRILAAEPTVEDEKVLYRFKLLDKKRGRVQVIIIDPDKMPDLTAALE